MKAPILIVLCLGTSLALQSGASHGTSGMRAADPNRGLPTAAERDAIAREDHKTNVADAAALLQLAVQLKADIENQTAQTVPATAAKEAEKIEKLAHGIQGRLKH